MTSCREYQPPITTAGRPIYLLEEEWGNIKRTGRIGHQIQAALIINRFTICVIDSAVEEFHNRTRSFNMFSTMLYLRYLKDLIFNPYLRFTILNTP